MNKRFATIISLLFFSITVSAQVEISSSSKILVEAERLVEVVPEQSKQIAQKFLTSRTLTNKKKNQSSNSRDEANNTLRTPNTSIDALHIIAKAMMILGDNKGAIDSIEQAEVLARSYQLPYVLLETQILKARLLWQISKDKLEVQPIIDNLDDALSTASDVQLLDNSLHYQLFMLKADIASYYQQVSDADKLYQQAESYLDANSNKIIYVDYQIQLGEYYLSYQEYNKALYPLLSAYWTSVENDMPIQLAKINQILAKLFYQKHLLDKSLEHLSQAADFYDNYQDSPILPSVLKQMADIYYDQGKFNLALVHYFNVLDAETISRNIEDVIELRLDLAKTYLQLYNYPLTEQYIKRANALLSYANLDRLDSLSLLLQAKLYFLKGHHEDAIKLAKKALKISSNINNISLQINAYYLLTNVYEKKNDFSNAFYYGKQYNKLITTSKNLLIDLSENDFRQQKLFIERSLHYKDQTEELAIRTQNITRYRYSTTILFFLSMLLVILFIHRGEIGRAHV